MDKLYGYVGKIARINLTDSTVSVIPTTKYVPEYIGGRSVCNKIFWDEVKPGVKAFDPENKVIYMTGPTTATGIPTGGRTVFTTISPNSLPEQYAWSGIGGSFGAEIKFAGYDGFILEGKAPEPTYLYIEDNDITFLSARNLWGKLVHATQRRLEEIHGNDVKSIVIGPAGENLIRNASVTTSNDNVAAKAGLGAVFGSKNLKAITVRGTGTVVPADSKKVLELRMKMAHPSMLKRPVINETHHGLPGAENLVPGGWKRAQVACSYGCNQHCMCLMLDMKSAFTEEKVNHVEKCVSIFAFAFDQDVPYGGPGGPGGIFQTEQNHFPACKMIAREVDPPDTSDPYFKQEFTPGPGDILDFWKHDFDKGSVINDLCNEYGVDKWDVIIWLLPWLSMGKKEGVFDDIDFGKEIDVESEEFVRYLMDMIVYRKGYYGNLLAEGMARAIRVLGKEKFGDTIYHGRYSRQINKQLDLPISLETAWGHSVHWQGRGFEASIAKPAWVATNLHQMTATRDTQTIQHHHDKFENYLELKDDPCRSPLTAKAVVMGENKAELKDSVTCCDWQSPNLFWTDMEAQMFTAATGIPMTEEELNKAAERSRNLFRAIIIRNYDRTRELEVNAIFPIMQFPDPWGETVTWDEWNDLVDLYYALRGWDKETGWPTRETYENYGLNDVADVLETIGKLP
ncbi:aldehyde ferredoxin oxidoreductase [Dehalobacter sp. DCM]|uniref:aldehyde ferredoxin oxidoreductase N-terminal domain-containing protein n=1 Tax=Dehalobacter sp. DCM TaxID=2907827 RepID=UPI003081D14F|nr:aldehyde ferredoxin oxidoreductase [Dehalobacter sp. DCM]